MFDPLGLQDITNCIHAVPLHQKQLSLSTALQTDLCILKWLSAVQDATHILVQRAAQLEFDLDQTAAMLCNEMAQGLESQNAIARLQELSAYEQGQRQAAMAVASSYRYKLYIKKQELHHANEQLSAALVSKTLSQAVVNGSNSPGHGGLSMQHSAVKHFWCLCDFDFSHCAWCACYFYSEHLLLLLLLLLSLSLLLLLTFLN